MQNAQGIITVEDQRVEIIKELWTTTSIGKRWII